VITEGGEGARVISADAENMVPGRKVQAVDICGAGDSFSAGAACALAITNSPIEAARFGNLVASITVTKKGTGTASPDEVRAAASTMPA
jgi:sugar/nucleoside kinase (ribokinase family)